MSSVSRFKKSRNLHAEMVLKLGKTKMTMGRRDKKRATDNRTPGEGKIFGLLLLRLFLFFRRNRDNEIVLPPLSAAIGSGAQIEFLLCLSRSLARSARVEVNTIDSLGMHERPRARIAGSAGFPRVWLRFFPSILKEGATSLVRPTQPHPPWIALQDSFRRLRQA